MQSKQQGKVKAFVFVSFVFSFSGRFAAIWILATEATWEQGADEPALRVLLQNLLLFASSLLFRVVRTQAES